MSQQAEFRDARLVAVYDAANGWSRDDDLFLSLVDEEGPARVVDLGCGTGRLALGLAAAGHTVTGVDPAAASLDVARAKAGADEVTWVEGTARSLPDAAFDVAIMTSHVAQFLVDDAEWADALSDLHRTLAPGGRLLFDTRNPVARGWERWNPTDSRHDIRLPDGTSVTAWTEVTAVKDSTVSFTHHYAFDDGTVLNSSATLRFRTEEELRASLDDAGFVVEAIYGGWLRQPVGPSDDGEFLVVARRRPDDAAGPGVAFGGR